MMTHMPDNIGSGESYPTDDPRYWEVEWSDWVQPVDPVMYLMAYSNAQKYLEQSARGEIPHD